MDYKLLTFGNLKLPASIGLFGLPAGGNGAQAPAAIDTRAYRNIPCDGFGTCAGTCAGCYALNAEQQYKKTCRAARIRNYRAAILPSFVADMMADIDKRLKSAPRQRPENRLKTVRPHDSGDFFTAAYVRAWAKVARHYLTAAPALKFYAYTKRLAPAPAGMTPAEIKVHNEIRAALIRYILPLNNFTLIDSMSAAGRRGLCNYGTIEELAPARAAGAHLCPCHEDATRCGRTCFYCMGKRAQNSAPVFVKH
jgi:hypothetical protein